MRHSNTLRKLVFLCGFLLPFPSIAQDVATFGRVEGMGRAGVANPNDNTTVTLNPASIALRERYEVQGGFMITRGPDYHLLASVVDSKTSAVSMGLTYHRARLTSGRDSRDWPGWIETGGDDTGRKRFDGVTLALAYPFLERKISVGINGTLSRYNHDIQGKGYTGNLDFGVSASPIEQWSIGIVGRNLIPVSGCGEKGLSQPVCIPDFDTGLAIGNYIGTDEFGGFALDIDLHFTHPTGATPVSVRTGIQKVIGENVIVNTGYRWEGPYDEHWLNFGVGLNRNNSGLHYTVGLPLHSKPFDPLSITHLIAVRVVSIGTLMGNSDF